MDRSSKNRECCITTLINLLTGVETFLLLLFSTILDKFFARILFTYFLPSYHVAYFDVAQKETPPGFTDSSIKILACREFISTSLSSRYPQLSTVLTSFTMIYFNDCIKYYTNSIIMRSIQTYPIKISNC